MSNEIADILNRAADYIEKHGWHQDDLVSQVDGSVCALGAIGMSTQSIHLSYMNSWEFYPDALQDESTIYQAITQLAKTVSEKHGSRLGYSTLSWLDIGTWNDAVDTTKEEVLDTMRLAAQQCSP